MQELPAHLARIALFKLTKRANLFVGNQYITLNVWEVVLGLQHIPSLFTYSISALKTPSVGSL